jgi:hypothetical protein
MTVITFNYIGEVTQPAITNRPDVLLGFPPC